MDTGIAANLGPFFGLYLRCRCARYGKDKSLRWDRCRMHGSTATIRVRLRRQNEEIPPEEERS